MLFLRSMNTLECKVGGLEKKGQSGDHALSVLDSGGTAVNKVDRVPVLMELHFSEWEYL